MNAIDRDDTEKKIAEIREALDAATPGPWEIADTTDGYVLLDAEGRELAFFDRIERADDARFIANVPEWLRFLLGELIKTRNSWLSPDTSQRLIEDLIDKVERINKMTEERDKLIEVLRWYADTENWRLSLTHMLNDGGQRARDILKEIGVTVE